MPTNVSELKKKGRKSEVRKNGRTQQRMLEFLKRNKTKAFSQGELGEQLEMSEQQARKIALALCAKGVVERYEQDEPSKNGGVIAKIYYMAI